MDQITASKNVLKKLISPKFDGKVLYDISIETNDDTGTEYFMVDVIIDDQEYWKYYDNGPYDSPSDLDDELGGEIKKSLKYAGVNKAFIDVFIMEGLERYSDYLDIPQEQFENYLFQYLNSTFSDKFVPGNLVRGIRNECRD